MFNNHFEGTVTHWIDLQTGVELKRTVDVTRGVTTQRPFEAVRVSLPSRGT